ncbi:Oxoglutarate and iron-dependent oxygenase degradation C-term-domain-containing protein [Colletotrichum godetiae]|uniref:uS12 prolyl 3,4-dihydroxylase n=1 Tax=Colletotrichum godetiae TaxID=1209918 RepID=A0AAJ0EY21_9PEZI|nr:Oxoglutarate and iron-dependent oxygenase degradation C-term-domain-containing protein [Colletotrichum godetiae]KAK1688226.1 Oxoglutarate and iron-dependent oxygenase degradation C-term-domain-containing protein [Colletotrichum godetiae]
MKRKASSRIDDKRASKKKTKTTLSADVAKSRFRKGLFDKKVHDAYTKQYAESSPYKHSVINGLVDDALLRSVRDEIRENVSFTPKETDIYKIHQSGDLANLDGLDDDALAKLPSLLSLRDAIYSETFRDYVSHITGCGPLSGRKTDMAINVYTPGCYLLCHDDVIGSRKVSYILYLTDPDTPWKPEWGGALRLFPVLEQQGKDGEIAKTPAPDHTKVIPPAWNQLSFFAVQPGESFHDVEEVYHAQTKAQLEAEGGRVRMAISGWFHIPQIGEDGYVEGAEEKQVKNSGLMQLQGNPDQHDTPQARPVKVDKPKASLEGFDEAGLEFLLKYIAPTYLTPDTLEQISEHFEENSSITLSNILSKKFSARLKEYIESQESSKQHALADNDSDAIEKKSAWRVARPPHKHRFLYQQPAGADELRSAHEENPLTELLDHLLPSRQFREWLQVATGTVVENHEFLARRFRRGQDYTLATGHDGKPRLEFNLGITPSKGWGDEEEDAEEEKPEEEEEEEEEAKPNGKASKKRNKGKGKAKAEPEPAPAPEEETEVGGHEVYMAGDDGEEDEDAAIYKSSGDDDNILFFQAAAWNKLTLVLRDSGTLRFVKYVGRAAKGDRWDVSGALDIEDEDEEGAKNGGGGDDDGEEESEEEWNGFSDSPAAQSDSD